MSFCHSLPPLMLQMRLPKKKFYLYVFPNSSTAEDTEVDVGVDGVTNGLQ